MARPSRQDPLVREYILRNVTDHPGDIAAMTADEFGLSRTAINRYTRRLIEEGLLVGTGNTRARRYALKNLVDIVFTLEGVTRLTDEDTVWRYRVLPNIYDLPKNIVDICQYGFTEILNNVIDHSLSDDAIISFKQNYCKIIIGIVDSGVGIFQKIQNDFDLADARSALLELSKGKLTSDKKRHSGEGIYFTSRMFDAFSLRSGNLSYSRERSDASEWLTETENIVEPIEGTVVFMEIPTDAGWTTREIFDKYQGENLRFRKTHVPVSLGNYPGEQLVSRSQAKRVLARFNQFSEIILDFENVDDIGQAFADEIFRVFRNAHPEIKIFTARTNKAVDNMIEYVSRSDNSE